MNPTDTQARFYFEKIKPNDPRLIPVLDDLVRWYHQRYGDLDGHDAWGEIHHDLDDRFTAEHGGIILAMLDGDTVVATGAVRKYDAMTAEFKKFWSHPQRRGEGLATALLARLEVETRRLGYRKVYLTTGPRQPEADRLYQRNGFTAHFDPQQQTPHIYTKALVHGVDGTVLPARADGVLVDFEQRLKAKKTQAAAPAPRVDEVSG